MSQHHEFYRYAAAGTRSFKYHHTGSRQQQARYLPGLELRSDTTQQRLLTFTAGHSRIYRQGSQKYLHFILRDRQESVYGAVDENGNLVSREGWYPFGGTASWLTVALAGAAIKFQRYAGKERDISGLIFYGWRYYVPWLMRWLSNDPAGTVDGLNLFRMVGNNPVTLRDRDGRMMDDLFSEVTRDLNDWLRVTGTDNELNLIAGQEQNSAERSASPPSALHLTNEEYDFWQPILPDSPSSNQPPPQLTPAIYPSTSGKDISFAAGFSCSTSCLGSYRCKFCPRDFTTTKGLHMHLKQGHQNEIFSCSIEGCSQVFYGNEFRSFHLNNHEMNKFKCMGPLCGKDFNSFASYYQHLQPHNVAPIYRCDVEGCAAFFYSEADLPHHKQTHLKADITCKDCGKSFSCHTGLAAHSRAYRHHTV